MTQGAHQPVEVVNSSTDAGNWKDDMDGWNGMKNGSRRQRYHRRNV